MDDQWPGWPREKRQLPANLAAVAAAHPGGGVAEIDRSAVEDPDGYVPPEAIMGVFLVGPDGRATGDYARNPQHGPVHDDFAKLGSPGDWVGWYWLPDPPGRWIRDAIEEGLAQQVAGAAVEWVKILEDPVFLAGGVRSPSDPNEVTIRRAALAVIFALRVRAPGQGTEILTGAFSWAADGLDRPDGRRDRLWTDLGMSRERAAELLKHRIYHLDEAR